ncbi:TetR/AcrR family transcriptional regulator [Leifsonia sp. 2TAF2]|uniref:TetR/AcrR family transcriptional regulator n=1 Tax=Leifsonia sp. 2TAF2 TaxID=3233009 RepID=UPI003F9E757A
MTPEVTRLRSDAQENRDRILAAAAALFAERGLDVGMRDIARRADVGPATLYRRFPTRQGLIDEAFAIEFRTCRRIVEEGCADPDAWSGFTGTVQRLIVLNVRNRGFVDALVSSAPSAAIAQHRRELLGLLGGLARRAQHEGMLRADFAIDDLVVILAAGRGLTAARPDLLPAVARRFADLAIDAFRGRPDDPAA